MNYTQFLNKILHIIKQRPGLIVATILLALALWLQTTLQGTIDWTGKGMSIQWNTLPNPYSLALIGTLTILWMAYRLIRRFQAQLQKN